MINGILKIISTLPEMSVSNNPESNFKIDELFSNPNNEPSVHTESNKTSLKTSSTEDMASSIEILIACIKALQELFIPYVEPTQKEILPLLKYYINEDVRQEASNVLPEILDIVVKFGQKENVVAFGKSYISELLDAIDREFDNRTLSIMLENLCDVINIAGPILNQSELNLLFDKIMHNFDEVEQRRLKLENRHATLLKESKKKPQHIEEDDDDDEDENLAEEIEEDILEIEEIQGNITDVIGIMFKTHKDLCGDIVQKIVTQMLPKYLDKNASEFEITMGIFIVDDMIEFLGQDYLKQIWSELQKAVVMFCEHDNEGIRQAASYGVGIFATFTKYDFKLYADDCLKALLKALNIDINNRDEKEWGTARDNATASLGKIIKHQSEFIDYPSCIAHWVRYLPIVYDLNECEEQHNLLCDIIIRRPELILGNNYSNLPSLLRILAKIYKSAKYTTNEIDTKIKSIFDNLKANEITYRILLESLEGFEKNIQTKIKKIISEQ
jgi:hypothetical protein